MKYTLYGARGSGSGIIEAVLAEIGAEYEVRDLDARNDEHREEAYAAINPLKKMPALVVDDGEVMTESLAIVLTLAERYPNAGLLPPPASPERAQAVRWMVAMATELYPMVELIDYPERFAPSAEHEAFVRERAESTWRSRWRAIDRQISGSPFCLMHGFCAADLYLTKLALWLDPNWRRENTKRIETVVTAVLARPTLATVWARHAPR